MTTWRVKYLCIFRAWIKYQLKCRLSYRVFNNQVKMEPFGVDGNTLYCAILPGSRKHIIHLNAAKQYATVRGS